MYLYIFNILEESTHQVQFFCSKYSQKTGEVNSEGTLKRVKLNMFDEF